MDKFSAFSVSFSNVNSYQSKVLCLFWDEMFTESSEKTAGERSYITSDFYDESRSRLRLIAEIAEEPLPYINARVMEEIIDWIAENMLRDFFVLRGVTYMGAFIVTDAHLQAPLNIIRLLPKEAVSNTQTDEVA